jgi:hypothetical protein
MKKLLATIIVTAVVSITGTLGVVNYTQPTTEAAIAPEWTVRGDFNCNGRIDFADPMTFAEIVIQYQETVCVDGKIVVVAVNDPVMK